MIPMNPSPESAVSTTLSNTLIILIVESSNVGGDATGMMVEQLHHLAVSLKEMGYVNSGSYIDLYVAGDEYSPFFRILDQNREETEYFLRRAMVHTLYDDSASTAQMMMQIESWVKVRRADKIHINPFIVLHFGELTLQSCRAFLGERVSGIPVVSVRLSETPSPGQVEAAIKKYTRVIGLDINEPWSRKLAEHYFELFPPPKSLLPSALIAPADRRTIWNLPQEVIGESEIHFVSTNDCVLDSDYLQQNVIPLIGAVEKLNRLLVVKWSENDEIERIIGFEDDSESNTQLKLRVISQNSPVSIKFDGNKALETVLDTLSPMRRSLRNAALQQEAEEKELDLHKKRIAVQKEELELEKKRRDAVGSRALEKSEHEVEIMEIELRKRELEFNLKVQDLRMEALKQLETQIGYQGSASPIPVEQTMVADALLVLIKGDLALTSGASSSEKAATKRKKHPRQG